MTPNKTFVYKNIPFGLPVPGRDLVIEIREIDLESPPKGGLIVEILYASFDPSLRARMRDPSIKSWIPAFIPNDPIVNFTVAKVLKSDSLDFKQGDIIKAYTSVAEYAVISDPKAPFVLKIQDDYNLDLTAFIGALGIPGLTAWSSLYKIGQPKKGETILVSSAAGAVGQLVGQIAKKEGLTVIGSVGSDQKLDYITKDLGFDAGFNYKKETPGHALKRLAPNGIDIYYDNVGGEHLEAAIDSLNAFGRVIASGMISQYNNTGQGYGIHNLRHIIGKQLTIRGFIVSNPEFGPAYYEEHQATVRKWLVDGSLKSKTSLTEGIDNAPGGLVGLFEGKNFGKAVLRINSLM